MKNKLLASAIASALVIGVGAEASDVNISPDAFTMKVSGQISRVVVSPDDAAGDELQFLDNNISGSRFRIKASKDLDGGMKVGTRLEAQFQSNKGNNANGGTYGDTGGNTSGDDTIDLRYQDIYFSGDFGKISLGKGDGAGNGTTETDLSGTYIIAAVNATDLYGGFLLDDATEVDNVYSEIDAYSRVNRVRYDTPSFSGLSAAISRGQREVTELAVRYSGNMDGIKFKAAAFYGDQGESGAGLDNGDERMGGSASVLLDVGLNLTLSYSEIDRDESGAEDRENMWAKLGYKTGKHAFAVDYGETETTDNAVVGTDVDAETVGVSYLFAPAKGVEIFAGYREYTSDDVVGTNNTDVELVTVGSRVKF